jgi:hypothetical protein
MSQKAQNVKNRPDALGILKNMSGSGRHENEIGHPRYCLKRVRARKTLTGPDTLGIVENESGSAKLENETRRHRYRRKRVRTRKTLKQDPKHSAPSKTSPEAQNMKNGPDAPGIAENESGSAKR